MDNEQLAAIIAGVGLLPVLRQRRSGLLVMLSPERKEVYSEPQKTNFRRKLSELETIIAALAASKNTLGTMGENLEQSKAENR